MTNTSKPGAKDLEALWIHEGAWRLSPFARSFHGKAKARYPRPTSCEKSPWPSDAEGVAQNITYLLPGHLMKVNKVLCRLLGDDESLRFLTRAGEFTIMDLACGPAMASVATVDFLIQLIRAGAIKRETPLTISFILNDLRAACVEAALANLELVRTMAASANLPLRIGSVNSFQGSIVEILPFLKPNCSSTFDLLCFSNAFDHVLIYGEEALKDNPSCQDPIARARPCDRPALLADFLLELGAYANPYFSRALFLQEWRHSPLMPIALPTRDLKVVRARMVQEVVRPDIAEETMAVRFCYCGCRYGYSNDAGPWRPALQPLPAFDDIQTCFGEEWAEEDAKDFCCL